jgi:nitrogen fixation protein FixH
MRHSYTDPSLSPWRFFPMAALLSLAVVIAVNGLLAYFALSTFPGLAVANDFDTSNRYDQVLEAAQRQAALGWNLQARLEAGHPVLVLIGRDGQGLDAAEIIATAQRPLGPPQTVHPRFVAEGAGRYRADTSLEAPGQWDLLLQVIAYGQTLTATRRVILQ